MKKEKIISRSLKLSSIAALSTAIPSANAAVVTKQFGTPVTIGDNDPDFFFDLLHDNGTEAGDYGPSSPFPSGAYNFSLSDEDTDLGDIKIRLSGNDLSYDKVSVTGPIIYANLYSDSTSIGPGTFVEEAAIPLVFQNPPSGGDGGIPGGSSGFIALKIKETGTHYGFLEVSVNPDQTELTVYGFGVETLADTPITTASVAAVPEPAENAILGILAAGSAIAYSARRKRKAKK